MEEVKIPAVLAPPQGPRKTRDRAVGSLGVDNNSCTENGFPSFPESVPEKQGMKAQFCGSGLRGTKLVL